VNLDSIESELVVSWRSPLTIRVFPSRDPVSFLPIHREYLYEDQSAIAWDAKRLCVECSPNILRAKRDAEQTKPREQNEREGKVMQDPSAFSGQDGPHEEVRIGQLVLRFLVDDPASGASVTIFEMNVPPGAKGPCCPQPRRLRRDHLRP
jgi:hypothetical protein